MVLSEDKDTSKLKSGVIGVFVLLVLGGLGPVIIQEALDVDLDQLECTAGQTPGVDDCLEPGDLTAELSKAIGYVPIIVAVVALIGFTIVGVMY